MENEYTLILILIVAIFVVLIYYRYIDSKKNDDMLNKEEFYNSFVIQNENEQHDDGETCTKSTCDSIDPVSDPKYNMQQIIKQSILLEEHLTNKNKRCRDCITKHFLHIIGLSEEAQMLATNKIDKYPLINESVELYNGLFKIWIKNKNSDTKDESYILYCTNKLRDHRKQLIVLYFFNEKYKINEN